MAKRKSESTKNNRKSSDALNRLNKRQSEYVKGVTAGKTKRQAALDAGYSESSAENAAAIIEGPDVRRAFQQLIRGSIPPRKIVERLAEGLDAIKSWTDREGESHFDTDYRERREYLKLAAQFGGYHVEKHELEVTERPLETRTKEDLEFFIEHGVWPEEVKV